MEEPLNTYVHEPVPAVSQFLVSNLLTGNIPGNKISFAFAECYSELLQCVFPEAYSNLSLKMKHTVCFFYFSRAKRIVTSLAFSARVTPRTTRFSSRLRVLIYYLFD